ncbi:MAG: hypothetical protein KBF43_10300 [Dermatophilaceae bacterium]|jgi:hypothetical protein|nr:hypothetical protein [Actinomycetales bacterium]MBP8880795.1 hypothetical protein [Dermatophilaceae bacterium]MBP9918964.1 hypothetical protein [Dermatophilaceae bacterium]
MFVITADQVDRQRAHDRVPAALSLLTGPRAGAHLGFERTAGDEIQGVCEDPADVVDILTSLIRHGDWRIGLGIGPVELPLPTSPRAGRGPAFVASRDALVAAHPVPGQLAVRCRVGSGHSRADRELRLRHTRFAETALLLYARLLRSRTMEGWQVTDLLMQGLTQKDAATRLGVTPSAVSQRVRRAGWQEQQRGRELVIHHVSVAGARPGDRA